MEKVFTLYSYRIFVTTDCRTIHGELHAQFVQSRVYIAFSFLC